MLKNKELEEILEKIDLNEAPPAEEPMRQYYFMKKAQMLVKQKSEELGRPLTYHVTTFGCQMNARDSEKLVGILDEVGYTEVEDENADFVIYNTCTVRENANQRVYGRLGYLHSIKKKKPHMMIALCGCMMQEAQVVEKLKKSYSFVNLIFGTHNIYKFSELIVTALESDRMVIDIWKDTDKIVEDLPSERKYAFKSGVNIMFGCNNFCSYCIVPYVRGRERSRTSEDIVREIKSLVADGVKEITLLGQNVNSYGKNLEEDITFAQLLRKVNEIEGLERIRFMTSHPKDLSDELIIAMKECDKVCNHIHLPFQAGNNEILKSMNRRYTKEHYLELVEKIRKEIPDIAITTDILVGFPGEDEEKIEDTVDVVKKARFSGAFTFIYSKRTGTPAAVMENQVDEEVVKKNFNRVLEVLNPIILEINKEKVGKTYKVLADDVSANDPSFITGRLEDNSLVHFKADKSLIGEIVDVKITDCKTFYLIGERV